MARSVTGLVTTLLAALLLTHPSAAQQHIPFSGASENQPQGLLFQGARVIDGTGQPPLEGVWLLVRDDRIVAMGQGDPPVERAVRVVNLAGKTVLPGLADMHVHLNGLPTARWMLKLFLAHGITRVRDAGNSLGNIAAIQRWTENRQGLPKVHTSNTPIQGSYTEQRFLQPGDEVERLVDDYAAFGIDFIKVYNWLSSAGLTQLALRAEQHGIPVIGHTPLSWTSVGSIDGGIQDLQHLRLRPYEILDDVELVARYPVDGPLMRRTGFWAHLDPEGFTLARTLDAWEARKDRFFVTPTLVVQEAVAESYDYPHPKLLKKPGIERISPGLLERWKKASPPLQWGDLDPEGVAEAKASFRGMATFVGLAHERGIRILAGTDTPVPWLIPGASLHRELRHFAEQAGMTTLEAIQTATGRAAEALESPERGVVREGAIADLVFVDGDVSRDIRALARIESVMVGGRLYSRDELLAQAAAFAEQDGPDPEPASGATGSRKGSTGRLRGRAADGNGGSNHR